MARLTIDTGTSGNPATGDSLRSAFTKINENFSEVYRVVGDPDTGLLTTDKTNGTIKIQPNGSGLVEIDQLSISGDNITSLITNGTVNITGQATGGVKIEEILFVGSSISSQDSTIININDGVVIDGPLTVNGEFVLNDLVVGTLNVDNLNFNDNVISSDSNADILLSPGGTGSVQASGIAIRGTTISSDDSTAININEALIVDGTATVAGALSSATSLALATGATVTGIADEDDMTSNSATLLSTQQSIKAYVDATVTAQDLDFQGDSGGALNIDLDSETLTLTGGTGIDTTGASNTVTFAIDSTVATLADSQTLTNKTLTNPILSPTATTAGKVEFLEGTDNGSNKATLIGPASTADVTITLPAATDTLVGKATTDTFTNKSIDFDNNTITNIEVDNLKSGVLDTDLTAVAGTDTTLASAKAIKTYVDAQDANIASDTLTLTNKTFDAEGTGNALSNVDVANLKSGVLDTDISSVSGSDDTIASAKAIKTYVDSQVTAQDLDLAGDSGTGAVDLDSQSLTIAGGTGLASVAGSQTVTLNIDSTVATLTGSQTLTNKTLTSPTITNATISEIITNAITSNGSNADISIQPSGSGDVILSGIRINGTTLDSSDSSSININEGLIVDGTVTAGAFAGPLTGAVTGNADTATTSTNVTVADESTDTTCFPLFTTAASGDLPPKSGTNLTFNSGSGVLTASGFIGALTGTASIASAVVVADESSDTTCFPLFASGATSGQTVKSGSNLTFNSSTGIITATGFAGTSVTTNDITVQTSGTATLASSSASVLDSFASATFRSAKYMVSIKNTANSRFETAELLVVHDGTNSFIYSTGVSSTGDAMATYTTDIDSGNVRILVVPQTADSTVYKFQRTLIVV